VLWLEWAAQWFVMCDTMCCSQPLFFGSSCVMNEGLSVAVDRGLYLVLGVILSCSRKERIAMMQALQVRMFLEVNLGGVEIGGGQD